MLVLLFGLFSVLFPSIFCFSPWQCVLVAEGMAGLSQHQSVPVSHPAITPVWSRHCSYASLSHCSRKRAVTKSFVIFELLVIYQYYSWVPSVFSDCKRSSTFLVFLMLWLISFSCVQFFKFSTVLPQWILWAACLFPPATPASHYPSPSAFFVLSSHNKHLKTVLAPVSAFWVLTPMI